MICSVYVNIWFVSVGAPSFPQLYTILRPSGVAVSDILALCNAITTALNVSC